MTVVVAPVMLNPKILAPRFCIHAFGSLALIDHPDFLRPDPNCDEPQHQVGQIGVTTFPAVYQKAGKMRPYFGQIFPRGLE